MHNLLIQKWRVASKSMLTLSVRLVSNEHMLSVSVPTYMSMHNFVHSKYQLKLFEILKGLSHEIDLKNVDKNLQN
jgi:hypothetical protein